MFAQCALLSSKDVYIELLQWNKTNDIARVYNILHIILVICKYNLHKIFEFIKNIVITGVGNIILCRCAFTMRKFLVPVSSVIIYYCNTVSKPHYTQAQTFSVCNFLIISMQHAILCIFEKCITCMIWTKFKFVLINLLGRCLYLNFNGKNTKIRITFKMHDVANM